MPGNKLPCGFLAGMAAPPDGKRDGDRCVYRRRDSPPKPGGLLFVLHGDPPFRESSYQILFDDVLSDLIPFCIRAFGKITTFLLNWLIQ